MPTSEPAKSQAALWEQWLQRLSSAPHPASGSLEAQRLNLFELILKDSELNAPFLARLGNQLARAFRLQAILFYEKRGSDSVIQFSNLSRKQIELLARTPWFKRVLERRTVFTDRLRPPVSLPQKYGGRMLHLLVMPIYQHEAVTIGCVGLSKYELNRADRRAMEILAELARLKQAQRRLNDALSSETDRLSTLTHQLSEGLMILNRYQRISLWNRPLQRLTGFSPREADNQPYKTVFYRLDNPDWLNELINQYGREPHKNVFDSDFEIKTKQGLARWVNISGSFLRDRANQIEQTIVLVRDISRNKELEGRKNEFISIATHELRTPITAIKGYLHMLSRDAKQLTDKQKNYLMRAIEANDRLVRLAEDLLQVTHVEENRLQFSLRPIDLFPLVKKVSNDFLNKIEKKGLSLEINPPNFSTLIAADPVRMEQVVANLIDNAIKYTPRGKITLGFSEHFDSLTKERKVSFQITDTGLGMSAKEQQVVFEKFHRLQSAHNSRESGAGLGLFIVKSFIEKQGGEITVRSRPNRGTTFTVTFPAVEAKALGRREA